MRKIYKFAVISLMATTVLSMTSCDDAFDPAVENHKVPEELEHMPTWAVGLLGHAYISNPLGQDAVGTCSDEIPDVVDGNDDGNGDRVSSHQRDGVGSEWRSSFIRLLSGASSPCPRRKSIGRRIAGRRPA